MVLFNCLYRRQNGRKNKNWEFDGFLRHHNGVAVLLDEEKALVTRFKLPLFDPIALSKREISKNGYDILLQDVEEPSTPSVVPKPTQRLVFRPPLMKSKQNIQNVSNVSINNILKPKSINTPPNALSDTPKDDKIISKVIAKPKYKLADTSIVMPSPPVDLFPNESFKDVILDPSLCSKLRDHQKDGLVFLYTRLLGFEKGINGSILADDMGMGKTLQTIALIWTLLNQSPFGHTVKSINKVIICCPVSLVNNWRNEFPKWLGLNRCPVLALNGSKYQDERQEIKTFAHSDYNKVLIIGYEKMVSLIDEISKVHFDLLVCDEGHRLKSSANKTLKVLESLDIKKRILLSGTPIQNDLNEFYTIVNFVVPNILGDFKSFQKDYMTPILKSRDPNCTNKELCDLGKQKSQELIEKTKSFILRRDNKELNKYLPPRTDYIIMIQPSLLQLEIFKTILQTDKFKSMLSLVEEKNNSMTTDSLSLINTFRKLCNSPSLLKDDTLFLDIVSKASDSTEDVDFRNQLSKKIKSGKMMTLIKIINEIVSTTDDKLVIVSNFTSTLDIIGTLLTGLDLPFLRLDGSTPPVERQALVNKFNKSTSKSHFAFLLSSKAGGVGLNLIGANRLVMFDNDWNPAVDNQSLARVHRDGQLKPVFVYRLITKGCIDEKILQRQVIKQDLADKFVDGKGGQKEVLDRDTLMNVFSIQGIEGESVKQTPEDCQTHELMGCNCQGDGQIIEILDDDEVEESSTVPEKRTFVNAFDYSQNDYKRDTESAKLAKQRRMTRCFNGYRHINPIANNEVDTNDEILNKLISKQAKDKVLLSWIFGKF